MRALRMMGTIFLLLIVWGFRHSRLSPLVSVAAGAWLERKWVTQPARAGTLGRRGPPRWVDKASGHRLSAAKKHRKALPARKTQRWW